MGKPRNRTYRKSVKLKYPPDNVGDKPKGEKMAEEERKKTDLELVVGMFRNKDKNENIYYTGKSEAGVEYVMFRNSYWKEGAKKPYFRMMKRVEKGAAASSVED